MRNSELPLVSIVIPVYNGANYMREAIESALSQTYPNIEVIVVNDGSTDGGSTHEIALSYKDRIRYYQKENGGVSSALNYGIKQMKGEYFAWLSHDDLHLPQKVEKQMDAVIQHEGNKPVICVCNYFLIDELGKEFARSRPDIEMYFRRSPKCFLSIETSLMIDGDATLISRQVFDKCGLFNESLFASQETDMWVRSLEVADFIFIPDYLVAYRSHPQQVTHRRAGAVGKEAGEYRGNLTKQTTLYEIQDYLRCEKDAVRLGLSSYCYMNLCFFEAAHQIIVKLRQLYAIGWKFTHETLTGMFEHGVDVDCVFSIMKKDISEKGHKAKILVYCQDWVEGGLASRLTALMASLQHDYEFILVYRDENSYALPKNISSIRLNQDAQGHKGYIEVSLALLAVLLDVDIFWSNAAFFLPNASIISYLKDSRIRTVASFHYLQPSANMFGMELNDEDWQTPLADASMITHEDHILMFTQHVYPYDAVLMPSLSDDIASCNKWRMFFSAVLSSGDYKKQLRKDLRLIDGACDTASPDEVIQKIQPHLAKYEEHILAKHRIYYERSIYWRITKPLRIMVNLTRKLFGKQG